MDRYKKADKELARRKVELQGLEEECADASAALQIRIKNLHEKAVEEEMKHVLASDELQELKTLEEAIKKKQAYIKKLNRQKRTWKDLVMENEELKKSLTTMMIQIGERELSAPPFVII